MVRLTATEVARNFSAVMNRVNAGEEIEIVRNGATVAELHRPVRPQKLKGDGWRQFVSSLPRVDPDFAKDVEQARTNLGSPESRWPAG